MAITVLHPSPCQNFGPFHFLKVHDQNELISTISDRPAITLAPFAHPLIHNVDVLSLQELSQNCNYQPHLYPHDLDGHINYNGSHFIKCMLTGASQTKFFTLKIIVFDNASTDDSLITLEQYADKIELIKHKENIGFPSRAMYYWISLIHPIFGY